MKTDALGIDADGMPLFRPDPAAAPSRIDVTTALRLEQETLHLQDLEASQTCEPAKPWPTLPSRVACITLLRTG